MNLKITFRYEHTDQRDEIVILKVRPARKTKISFSPTATSGMISRIMLGIKAGLKKALSERIEANSSKEVEVVVLKYQINRQRAWEDFFYKLFSQIINQETEIENTEIMKLQPYPIGKYPKFSISEKVTSITGEDVATERTGLIWDYDYHQNREEFVYKIYTGKRRYYKWYGEGTLRRSE